MRAIPRTALPKTALLVVISLSFVLIGSDAEAQRRRRRRPRPQPTEQPAEPTPTPEPEAPEATDPEAPPENPFQGEAGEGAPPPVEATPEPSPEPTTEPDLGPELPDLGPLRADFASLMDELVQARSRIAVLGAQLFQTKVVVRVENRASDQVLSRLTIRIDGAPVFRTDTDPGRDGREVFEGFAAPGPHDLTVELEQRARANESYRYTQTDRYRFLVTESKLTEITLVLDDDSDIAEDFEDDGEGEYDVRTRLRIATRELRTGAAAE